ncbi:signal peptidase I [Bacillus suaedae]|uniref:Signal peptidase I n=1 Tax=Halalkalibacter suaedae TaxID=2822140 RepID=A0A940WQL6_9BACI|nr:signal peptidase I [Bacillus suaedae]MBP3950720.1 signal peptidase I [Bacillus suaedae]
MPIQKFLQEIFSWTKSILVALLVAIIVSAFIIQPFTVSGSSMEPTFFGGDSSEEDLTGDRVMIFKSSYLLGQMPEYNDVVIIDSRISRERTIQDNFLDNPIIYKLLGNSDQENLWIKRVIGKAGDKLEFKNGKVFRNGTELNEKYVDEEMEFPFETITIPEGHIYVMGDNRNGSTDSRTIGPIPDDHVIGEVFFRFYPFDKMNTF